MFFFKMLLMVTAGALIAMEAVLALDDIVYAFRSRRVRSINSKMFFMSRNIKP